MAAVKRTILTILKVLICLEVVWLITGNLLLNTKAGPWLASIKPDKFTMQWESGWTPYPAFITAKNIKVGINTWSSQTVLEADSASATLRLLPLIGKEFIVDNLTAGKITIQVQHKRPDGERPPPSKPYPGINIVFRDASVASVQSFSFNQITLNQGVASASGSASFRIRGEKTIDELTASWKNAILEIGEEKFSETINIGFKGDIASFNPRKERGFELFEKISGQVELEGKVDTLTPLIVFFRHAEWIDAIDGQGQVVIDALLSRGRLPQGSIIDIDADDLELSFLGFRADGKGRVNGRVDGVGDNRAGQLGLVFDAFQLSRQGVETPLVQGKGLSLKTQAPNLSLTRQLSDLKITLDVPDSSFPDITAWEQYLPPSLGVSITGGSASVKGRLAVEGPERLATAILSASGKDVAGAFNTTEFKMDFSLESEATGQDLDQRKIELSGTRFKLFNGIFDNSEVAVDRDWWMEVEVPDGVIDLASPVAVDADVGLTMKDTRVIIALISDIKEWVSRFDGLLTVRDISGGAQINATEKHLRVSDLQLQGDRLDLVAELDSTPGRNDAIAWGKLGLFSGGFERIGDETSWKLVNARKWYDEQKELNWVR